MSITRIQPTKTQKVSYTATAAASASIATGGGTVPIRLRATTDCHVAFGQSPTATTSDMLLGSGETEYFEITAGHKVSAVRATADGDLFVTEGVGH